ncbi:glycosyltransferase family 2 protein [Helicobacter sp. T3_23-1056]
MATNFRNDDKNVDCHENPNGFAGLTSKSRNDRMSPSLAEGDKGGGYQYSINSNDAKFMSADSTLPLAPSAREGGQKENSRNDKTKLATKLAPKLAIVIPCYNEEAVIATTYNALCEKLDLLLAKNLIAKDSFLCFVDDGSVDRTCEILLSLKECKSPHKIIKLSRNYGHQNALLAGLEYVKDKCDCVISMDCDLQDDINAIDEMLLKFKGGAEIVYGVRKAYTNESAFKKYTSFGFYKFMQIMGVKILYNHADYRLLSARACEALLEFREVNLFLRGIVPLVGYKSAVVHYKQSARIAGESKYPLGKMLGFALNGITSFSIVPLRIMSVVGVILCALCVAYGGYAIFVKLFTESTLEGWTSTILILLFFGGMQFLGLGIMGEYIGKIYAEVKHRPRYFVEAVL